MNVDRRLPKKRRELRCFPIFSFSPGRQPGSGFRQKIYIRQGRPEQLLTENRARENRKGICPNWLMYLSKLPNLFVQIGKCICPNFKIYLSKLLYVFVQIAKFICPNCKIYLSKLSNIFIG